MYSCHIHRLSLAGTTAYDKLKSLLTKKILLNDMKKLSPDAQTKLPGRISCHSELLAPKVDLLFLAGNSLQVHYLCVKVAFLDVFEGALLQKGHIFVTFS